MHQEIKKKWIEALRSGEYDQTKGWLHDKKGYCCLGVLCDLYLKETGEAWQRSGYNQEIYTLAGMAALLPDEVIKWAGIPTCLDEHNCTCPGPILTKLNDTGASFDYIAGVIAEQL